MATITKRASHWRVSVGVKGQSAMRTFMHIKDARTWASDVERAFTAGASSSAGLRTFVRDIVVMYVDELERSDAKDKAEPKRLAHWWDERIGAMRLGDVSPATI